MSLRNDDLRYGYNNNKRGNQEYNEQKNALSNKANLRRSRLRYIVVVIIIVAVILFLVYILFKRAVDNTRRYASHNPKLTTFSKSRNMEVEYSFPSPFIVSFEEDSQENTFGVILDNEQKDRENLYCDEDVSIVGFDIETVKVGDLFLSNFIDNERSRLSKIERMKKCGVINHNQSKSLSQSLSKNSLYKRFRNLFNPAVYVQYFVGKNLPTHVCFVGEIIAPSASNQKRKHLLDRIIIYDFTIIQGLKKITLRQMLHSTPNHRYNLYYLRTSGEVPFDGDFLFSYLQENKKLTIGGNGGIQSFKSYLDIGSKSHESEKASDYLYIPRYGNKKRSVINIQSKKCSEDVINQVNEWNAMNANTHSCSSITYMFLESWGKVMRIQTKESCPVCYVNHDNNDDTQPISGEVCDNEDRKFIRLVQPQRSLPSDLVRRDFPWADDVHVERISPVLFVIK